MSKISIMLIASALLLVGSSGLGYLNRTKLTEKQAEVVSTKASLSSTQGDLVKSKDAQKKAESAQKDAETKATDLQAQVASATTEVTNLKDQVAKADENIKAKGTEIDTLTAKLAAATPPPNMTPPPAVTEELEKLKHELAELQVIKDGLQTQVKAAQTSQQTAEHRLAARENGDLMAGLQGKVMAVDRNWNFVVLNLGGRSGVNANATMVVRRGGNLVGRVRITSVEPSQSIADIVPNSVPAGVSVQAGDTVVFSGDVGRQ